MTDREKLIELLCQAQDYGTKHTNEQWSGSVESKCNKTIANHLIANGVTFATDNNVGDKWIPVTERLPDKDGKYLAFNKGIVAGSGYCRVIGFAKDARKIDQYDFVEDWQNVWYFYDSEYGYVTTNSVTHWMPLPEPPKEE